MTDFEATKSKFEEEIDEDEAEEDYEYDYEEEEVDEKEDIDEIYPDYYEKNTASFRCLKEVLLSCSSLMRNALYHFPPLKDPGLDDVFYYIEPVLTPDDVGVEIYKARCSEFNIVPLTAVLRGLPTTTLDLKYCGLSSKQIRAISEALRRNRHVIYLNIEDNFLTEEDCEQLNEALLINSTIERLNMRSCQIGAFGASKLIDFIEATPIVDLDLSFNSIGNVGMTRLGEAFCTNTSIRRLNFSRNQLGEPCCEMFAKIFEINETIEQLDVSWNEIYTPLAMKKFFDGLSLNKTIKSLNFSWNGFGLIKESAIPLQKYLKDNEILEVLDLSNNRLFDESLTMIREGIGRAKALKTVKLSHNTITPEDAISLAHTLLQSKCLITIHLDCYVKKNFLPLLKKLKKLDKHVTIEGVLSNYVVHEPDVKKLLMKRIKYVTQKPKKKRQKVDFGLFQWTLPEEPQTRDNFLDLLKKGKLKMILKDKDLIDYLVDTFNQRSKVDCEEIKRKWMECYPDTKPPSPSKSKKKKKKKKDNKGKKDKTRQATAIKEDLTEDETRDLAQEILAILQDVIAEASNQARALSDEEKPLDEVFTVNGRPGDQQENDDGKTMQEARTIKETTTIGEVTTMQEVTLKSAEDLKTKRPSDILIQEPSAVNDQVEEQTKNDKEEETVKQN